MPGTIKTAGRHRLLALCAGPVYRETPGSTRQSRSGGCCRLAADESDLRQEKSSVDRRSRFGSFPAHIRRSPLRWLDTFTPTEHLGSIEPQEELVSFQVSLPKSMLADVKTKLDENELTFTDLVRGACFWDLETTNAHEDLCSANGNRKKEHPIENRKR
jgi:hypothetical protein